MYGFSGVYHDKLMQNLINSVHKGINNHAYIFEGAKGLGRHAAADLFASSLVCQNKDVAPCTTCPSCIKSRSHSHPDIIYVNSDTKKSIGADKMRDLSADASIKPFEASKKVYIIEDGDVMTEQAQNAFLKVLEEPPEYVVFIIISTSVSFLLQTVLSRAVLVRFSPLNDNIMREYIKNKYPDELDRIDFLVKYSGGVPGVLDDIVSDENFEVLRQNALNAIDYLISPKKLTAYSISDFLEKNKDQASLVFDFWEEMLRDILFLQAGSGKLLINSDFKDNLYQKSTKINDKATVCAIEYVIKAKQMLRRYVNLQAISMYLSFNIKKSL